MSPHARRVVTPLFAAVATAVAVAASGCGVAPEDAARTVEPPQVIERSWQTQTPQASDSGVVPVQLYLVRDNELVPATRRMPVEPPLDELVKDLVAGPTEAERQAGLTSALLGGDLIVGVRLDGQVAVVELAAGLDEISRTDQVLAFAQIVCTLTANSQVAGVSFTRDDQTVGVPRADGSLSEGPLTAADYAELIAEQ